MSGILACIMGAPSKHIGVEITPAMIEAGVIAYVAHGPNPQDPFDVDISALVSKIYRVMREEVVCASPENH